MADIFCNKDFNALLSGKRIVFIDMRAIYKDWVWLKQNNTIIPAQCLKAKLEPSFAGDSLLARSALHNGRDFREVREYQDESICLHFMFVTKCFSDDIRNMLTDFKLGKKPQPDIIIFNSCLWDLSRWGPNGVKLFQNNMLELMYTMLDSLTPKTLVLFTTTLPISVDMRGGFLVPDVDFLKSVVPYDIVEANNFLRDLVELFEFDVVDLHFHLRFELHRRSDDGVHWQPIVVRHLTNLLLTHICVSFKVKLPGRFKGLALERILSTETCQGTGLMERFQARSSDPTLKQEEFQEKASGEEIACPSSGGEPALDAGCKSGKSISNSTCDIQGSEHNAPAMDNLCEAPVKSKAGSKGATSSQGIEHSAPVMANLNETSVATYENRGGGKSSHGLEHSAPVMANLYETSVSSYGNRRGGMDSHGFRAQMSGGHPQALKNKRARLGNPPDNNQQKNQKKPSIHSRLGPVVNNICYDQNPNMNFYTQNQAQNYYPWMQAQNQAQNYYPGMQAQNQAQDYHPWMQAQNQEQDYHPWMQAQNQEQDYHPWMQAQNQEVFHHQHEGPWHAGGMHVSNYVDALQPINEEKAQALLNPFSTARGRGKHSRGFRRK